MRFAMPDKLGTVAFFIGPQGAGKTKLTAALLKIMKDKFNVNKDILAESLNTGKTIFSKFMYSSEEWLYNATLGAVTYNLRGGNPSTTAIVEGNFGKRLSVKLLKKHFGEDLSSYDFCLVHVTCDDLDLQYQRVLKRNDPKDKAVVANGKTFDITNKKKFLQYCELRRQEELACIALMSEFMRIIPFDNSRNLSDSELAQKAIDLQQLIECKHKDFLKLPRQISISVKSYENEDHELTQVVMEEQDLINPKTILLGTRSEEQNYSSPMKVTRGPEKLACVGNISPTKHPLLPPSLPPAFELEPNGRTPSTGQRDVAMSVDIRNSSSIKKGSSSPFLSFSGRVKEKSVHESVEKGYESGRKSPRWSDDWGRPISSPKEDTAVPITIRPLYNQ
jgi:cytochrome b involved in lipid metabolism